MAREGRGIIVTIWRNFIQSLVPKSTKGNLIGKDHLGTAYYEIPAEPQRGKRRPVRWFQATEKDKFDQDIPVEWEAWLRGRRQEPPTQEEINANIALAKMKKIKADELENKENLHEIPSTQDSVHHLDPPKSEFPAYGDFETSPGEEKDRRQTEK